MITRAPSDGSRPEAPTGSARPLAWIVLAGAAARLALWAGCGAVPLSIGDEKEYHAIAANLVRRGEFALTPGVPTSIRPPLYPALVAATYRAFGVGHLPAVRLAQAGLSLVGVVLAYRLAADLYGRRAGLVAAGLVAFYPSLLGFNNLLLTETLFTTLLVATCLALVRAIRARSLAGLALGGALLGLGALARSVLWPFPAALGVLLAWAWGGRARDRLAAAAVPLAAFCAVIAPWSIRNTRLERSFQTIDTMGGRNFMMGNYEHTPAYRAWDAISIRGERSWIAVLARTYPSDGTRTQGQWDKLALRAGLDYVRRHPGQTLRRAVTKFFDFWGLERELVAGAARGTFGPLPAGAIVPLSALIFGAYAAALGAGIFGMAVVPPADRRGHALLLLVVAFLCAVHTATFGHSRYHLPLMPLILAYAAGALDRAREAWARRRRPSFWLACGLFGVFVINWAWGLAGPDLGRYLDLIRPA